MADVFISYSTKDKKTADIVVEYLEKKGYSCWIAPRNISPGTDWASSISSAISSSGIFLMMYSKNSAASEQCAREIAIADTKKNVDIIPYKMDNTALVGSYEYYLGGSQWVVADCVNGVYKLEELCRLVKHKCAKTDAALIFRHTEENTKNKFRKYLATLAVVSLIPALFILYIPGLILLVAGITALVCAITDKHNVVKVMAIISLIVCILSMFAVFWDINRFYICVTCFVDSLISSAMIMISKKSGNDDTTESSDPKDSFVHYMNKKRGRPIVISCPHGKPETKVYLQKDSLIRIGRNKDQCSIVYDDNFSGVSSVHCSVSYDHVKNIFLVTDLGSTYGTFIMPDGKKIKDGIQYELSIGDSFCVGDSDNIIKLDLE